MLQSYISFEGRCQEAIDFYKQALGAEVVTLMRWKDAPPGACGEGMKVNPEAVMHACLKIAGTEVMMSDGMSSGNPEFKGISLSLSVDNDAAAKQRFEAISAGGEVKMPLDKTFFASSFGVCTDKFGVSWMVLAPTPVPVS